jgi:hypothetical protein
VAQASESRPVGGGGGAAAPTGQRVERNLAYRNEISEFCAAVRTGTPLRCGPTKAMGSALACIAANHAMATKTRVMVS